MSSIEYTLYDDDEERDDEMNVLFLMYYQAMFNVLIPT